VPADDVPADDVPADDVPADDVLAETRAAGARPEAGFVSPSGTMPRQSFVRVGADLAAWPF